MRRRMPYRRDQSCGLSRNTTRPERTIGTDDKTARAVPAPFLPCAAGHRGQTAERKKGAGAPESGKGIMTELSEYEVAEDMQIDGLKIVQDTRLYRFTSDSVLLSRFARAKTGDEVADFCAGSGIVAFHFYALHRKVRGLRFTLFEMQEALSRLSEKTIALNGFENFRTVCGKIQQLAPEYREKFSLILCNPPYERGGFAGEEYQKAICRKEITVNLREIAQAASFALRFGGRIVLTNRADRLAVVCYTFHEAGIEIKRVAFAAGREGMKPYLLLAEGVKGGRPGTEILPTVIN